MTTTPRPFPNSYWVLADRFLAGEHPSLLDPAGNRERILGLIRAEISVFVDLTEPDETADLESYPGLIAELAPDYAWRCQYHRLAIPDMGVPPAAALAGLLDTLDAALEAGRRIYVHCWGGIGRTGTVVGYFLVRQGWAGGAAIARLASLRADTPDARYVAPARDEQRQMILSWPAADRPRQ